MSKYFAHQAISSASGTPRPGMLQIEWKSSHYHSDGRRRSHPKASTVHGWLVKWRATFSGNERLRKEGIREMREAKAVREWKKQRKAVRQGKAGASKHLSRPWSFSLGKGEQRPRAPKRSPHGTLHPPSNRPTRASSRRTTPPTHPPRPTPTNSRRSSHNRHPAGDRKPHSSRQASYDSRGNSRAAEKKRPPATPS